MSMLFTSKITHGEDKQAEDNLQTKLHQKHMFKINPIYKLLCYVVFLIHKYESQRQTPMQHVQYEN